ncbi:hypothetical protein [Paraprevotella clara]|uniref:hypothetical protein n=1 Tax=Paraprevotella clara TaxID=454154 RepID=UPI0018AC8795|nr:hypothetical protein [Paraprevotella clara]MBS6984232.1 hypothetical protein [Paraprevotella clara]
MKEISGKRYGGKKAWDAGGDGYPVFLRNGRHGEAQERTQTCGTVRKCAQTCSLRRAAP